MNREDIVKTLSGRGGSPLDDYRNLVNQPTWVDNVGDAFIDQGKGQALNKNQKLENAMMSGFGHGMKGGANSARAAKLAGLEDASKQVALLEASANISNGKIKAKQMAFQNYFLDNYVDFKKANDLLGAGDQVGYNQLVGTLTNRFSNEYPDIAQGIGKFDHAYGDNSYFDNGKKVYGVNNKDVFAPFMDTLPEEQRREFPHLISTTARTKFEKSDLFDNLSLEEKRAGIANQYSQANQHNASAESTRHEMNNPEKEKGTIDPKKMEQDLDVLSQQITQIGEKGTQKLLDRWGSAITPSNVYQLTPEQTEINTLGQLMRGQIFKAFGYRNETEFEQIPTISSTNSVEQNQAIVKQYRNLYLKSQQGQDDIVEVISPSGKIGMIPKSSLEAAMTKGFNTR